MAIKEEKTFEDRNKLRDTLSEKVIKNLRSKGGDNMNGESRANDKLNMMADVSEKMTIPQVREYIRLYKTGGDVNKYLKQFKLLKPELDELQKLAARRTS